MEQMSRLHALAELASPLVMELSAGILERPAPAVTEQKASVHSLCEEIQSLLGNAVPSLRNAVAELADCDEDDFDDSLDELSDIALDCVDLARKIWSAALPSEAEVYRPLLAALVESPVVQVIAFFQTVIHAAIDPWAVFDDPEKPELSYMLSLSIEREKNQLALIVSCYPDVLAHDFLSNI